MKILLVEDNSEIAKNISEYLKLEGHIVAWNGRGDEGVISGLSYDFDVVLLDLSLPGKDGIEICRDIRKKKDIPIIMITARESVDQKVLGLESGANDYLVKPFDLRELIARIHAVTRTNLKKNIYEKGGIIINFDARIFSNTGKKITLTQKEFLILEFLFKHSPNLVTRTAIIDYVWGGEDDLFGADGKLDVYISNLRSKFGKTTIETVKGVGYKWGL